MFVEMLDSLCKSYENESKALMSSSTREAFDTQLSCRGPFGLLPPFADDAGRRDAAGSERAALGTGTGSCDLERSALV